MTRTLLIPALALAVAACADNRSSIEIIGRAAPSDPASCKFAPGGEIPGLGYVAELAADAAVDASNRRAAHAVAIPTRRMPAN